MAESKEDHVRRAFASLSALRRNVPQPWVGEELVNKYHDALRHLEEGGFDVVEFRVPDGWLNRRWLSTSGAGQKNYTKDRQVSTKEFLTRLDAVLTYFEISRPTEKGEPDPWLTVEGFKGPSKSS
jgi:tRNA-dihydrouridine synthase